jgi:hypothetical protein
MISPQLIEYIRQVRAAGHLDETIKQHLISNGYTKETVDEAFNSPLLWQGKPVQQQPNIQAAASQATSTRPAMTKARGTSKPILRIVLLLVLVATIGTGAFLLFKVLSATPTAQTGFCEGISVKVHELYDLPILCAFPDNSKLQVILKNDGAADLNYVEITAKSQRGETVQRLDKISISPGDVLTLVINVDATKGMVQEVTIVPGIRQDGGPAVCADKAILVQGIRTC